METTHSNHYDGDYYKEGLYSRDLFSLFLPQNIIEKVLAMHASSANNSLDTMCWSLTPIVQFNIATIVQYLKKDTTLVSELMGNLNWKAVWSWKCLSRANTYVSMALHGRLLTNSQ